MTNCRSTVPHCVEMAWRSAAVRRARGVHVAFVEEVNSASQDYDCGSDGREDCQGHNAPAVFSRAFAVPAARLEKPAHSPICRHVFRQRARKIPQGRANSRAADSAREELERLELGAGRVRSAAGPANSVWPGPSQVGRWPGKLRMRRIRAQPVVPLTDRWCFRARSPRSRR